MTLRYRAARPEDAAACVDIRGRTRENAISQERLRALGITVESWSKDIGGGALPGHIVLDDEQMVGYCFGSTHDGEIVVLALLPAYEGRGVGRALLELTVKDLATLGFTRLFLGCSSDPTSRSYGFYRHLGWRPTGQRDRYGDEVLELTPTRSTQLP